ncbi:adenylate kinase isoenzyme 5 isoform X3 [Bradysia coprophila]|uniref:adenylate kinase isoenzyme 5 isoform X3 n=1 Tax=Bradysia coprophila TaxID=38358 RepID=UPI00187D847F|nr:adenylate kinase isoenzyme 5 isoform X3 [Bradysia coprophila]
MGICLDTEANSAAQESDDPGNEWKGGGERSATSRILSSANLPMQNAGKVKFDPPKVPVIFVLGGPGSGKVTHCDTLMQEKKGVIHINMMDLLQQYAIGNDMQDFSQLSSKTVTEVLMLEIKMAPAAKAYLISGYPRSMRDVVEYSEKIQVINGVLLISWRQAVLQKQIDYGAKLGHVVLSLAKMELENFFKNVMPVADYFDQSDMLTAVNGERAPTEVYKDFRMTVLDILGAQENQEALLNGVAVPAVETPTNAKIRDNDVLHPNNLMGQNVTEQNVPVQSIENLPPIIWVIGGPGSNKATLCLKAIGLNPGWGHFSIGRLVRSIAESDPRANTENHSIKEAIAAGEMISKKSIDKLLETQLLLLSDKKGIIIDGYPRDMNQVKDFEVKYKQKPPIVLLDCSKLQLGRGRIDDTVSSFRRRLELFRELTLPMLKIMDADGRLTIVDGDTDSPSVEKEFEKTIRKHTSELTDRKASSQLKHKRSESKSHTSVYTGDRRNSTRRIDDMVQDMEDVPGVVPTISQHVSLINGNVKKSASRSGKTGLNGHIANGRPTFRTMLDETENPIDSYM